MGSVIIPDTSLCAIVRDEVMNPAGGVVDFVDSVMPFVEAGVIVDTGSEDGTRELLEDLALKYVNLEIYGREFDGYASSRNFSLEKVRTKRALVLDADERMAGKDFEDLMVIVNENPQRGYNFKFLEVYPDHEKKGRGHNPRLFEVSDRLRYQRIIYEHLYERDVPIKRIKGATLNIDIAIKHFLPVQQYRRSKSRDWSHRILMLAGHVDPQKIFEKSESQCPSFRLWKQYNPRREGYR